MNPVLFPALLAGPIIRRLDSSEVFVWVATSKEFAISAEIFKINTIDDTDEHYSQIWSNTETEMVQFGENLFINLIKITPFSNTFPTNQLIGYNLHFNSPQQSFHLGDLGLLTHSNPLSIVYDPLSFPTFYIPEKDSRRFSKFLFGSCRKPHGEGVDALVSADRLLLEQCKDLTNRPEALFLMGDQIYADDVADPLFGPINQMGKAIMGIEEDLVSIDKRIQNNSALKLINGRKDYMKDFASFTSRNASNHLIEFGEYAAMYLFSWSPVLWEIYNKQGTFESFEEAYEREKFNLKLSKSTDKLKKLEKTQLQKRYTNQEKIMAKYQSDTYKIRRLLANIPTYMIFDDHDITDDWNINADWKESVRKSPLGTHIVANGLSAYFAFQGWGNEPALFREDFIPMLKQYFEDLRTGQMMVHHKEWITLLWEHQPWHFVAPTTTKAVFLDTRTMREYDDKPNTNLMEQVVKEKAFPPQLVNEQEYKEITNQLKSSGWEKGDPLIIVSPTPVIGFDLIEKAILQFLPTLEKLGAHVQTIFDVEAWRYNGKGLTNLLNQLADWNPKNPVILSGDVHYSFSVKSSFIFSNDKEMHVKQMTSSPIKNMSFKNFGILMQVTAALTQILQQTETIYRYCDTSYKLHDAEKKSLPDREFLWKEQLLYDKIAGSSIIETDNTIGLLTYSADQVENRFLK